MTEASLTGVALGHTLLDRLAALRDAPEPAAALLVDFRGIEHGDDPRFALTLDHYLESWLGASQREVHRLPGPRLLILAGPQDAALLESGAHALAGVLRSHGFGTMRFAVYDVATQAGKLVADVVPPPVLDRLRIAAAAQRVPTAALAQVLEVERVLHGADVESLLREQALWSFADPEEPKRVLTELVVALDELEGRFDLPLRRDDWLRHEVAARLDRGLLRHVARDRWRAPQPYSFDLHTATVLDATFADLAHAIPAEFRRQLTAELACWEVGLSPPRFAAAAQRLGDLGFAVAVDHVPLAALPALDLGGAGVAYVKALWAPGAESAGLLAAGLERFGAGRLALWRCDDAAALETARAAGVVLVQGRAADAAVRAPALPSEAGPSEAGPAAPERRRAEESGEAEAPAGDEAEAAKPGLIARLFGRGA